MLRPVDVQENYMKLKIQCNKETVTPDHLESYKVTFIFTAY